MIISFILNIFLNFFNFIVGLLPTGNLDSSILTAISWFFNEIHGFDFILPVSTIIQVFIWAMSFEVAILFYKFILLIINKIRGAG